MDCSDKWQTFLGLPNNSFLLRTAQYTSSATTIFDPLVIKWWKCT